VPVDAVVPVGFRRRHLRRIAYPGRLHAPARTLSSDAVSITPAGRQRSEIVGHWRKAGRRGGGSDEGPETLAVVSKEQLSLPDTHTRNPLADVIARLLLLEFVGQSGSFQPGIYGWRRCSGFVEGDCCLELLRGRLANGEPAARRHRDR
jgi:hypothetical protein